MGARLCCLGCLEPSRVSALLLGKRHKHTLTGGTDGEETSQTNVLLRWNLCAVVSLVCTCAVAEEL